MCQSRFMCAGDAMPDSDSLQAGDEAVLEVFECVVVPEVVLLLEFMQTRRFRCKLIICRSLRRTH